MGRRTQKNHRSSAKSQTLPSSPTHSFSSSSSSSDFEFTIAISPRKSSAALCPADELFYKGQLLPLHLSPRLSMVRTLLLSSASTSSSAASDTTTTASRDSTASHSSSDSSSADLLLHHHLDCDSSRPSSVADEEFKRLTTAAGSLNADAVLNSINCKKPSRYFSLAKFSSVFRKNPPPSSSSSGGAAVRRVSSSAKEVIRKYLKKVKPFYEKLSQKHPQPPKPSRPPPPPPPSGVSRSANTTLCLTRNKDNHEFPTGMTHPKENPNVSQSFSGNLWYPRRRSCISSCPSSMMSSPSHSKSGFGYGHGFGQTGRGVCSSDASSMEELQSAIQGAIAHCKNSLLKNKNLDEV